MTKSTLAKVDLCRVRLTVLPKVSRDSPILQRDDSHSLQKHALQQPTPDGLKSLH